MFGVTKITIVAAVKTRDCLVLGTDSITTVVGPAPTGGIGYVKSYSHATKLLQLAHYPVGVSTWGAGNIGTRSISGLISEFGESLTAPPPTIKDAADQLDQFIWNLYSQTFGDAPEDQLPVLGFFVGGYSQRQPLAELWEVRLPGTNRVSKVRGQNDFGANWRGIELPFTRLHMGFDPRIGETLTQAGVPETTVEAALRGFQSPVIFDSMPVQSALNFCKYILRTTISFATFEVGVPSCGEPLQTAVILPKKGFEWVEELKFHE